MTNYQSKPCDVCDETKLCALHYGNMWFCDECWESEQKSVQTHMSPESQNARVDASNEYYRTRDAQLKGMMLTNPVQAAIPINQVLRDAASLDSQIQVRTDLFNAATKSIIDLKAAIDSDESITNKPYALAETLKNRFDHFKTVIFELNKQLIEAGNEQRAIQSHLNTMANTLRAEEREKLKIADINYKPAPPKAIKVKSIGTTGTKKKTKVDKTALKKVASDLGISEFTLTMLMTAKGLSLEAAGEMLRKSIDAAKG